MKFHLELKLPILITMLQVQLTIIKEFYSSCHSFACLNLQPLVCNNECFALLYGILSPSWYTYIKNKINRLLYPGTCTCPAYLCHLNMTLLLVPTQYCTNTFRVQAQHILLSESIILYDSFLFILFYPKNVGKKCNHNFIGSHMF